MNQTKIDTYEIQYKLALKKPNDIGLPSDWIQKSTEVQAITNNTI